MVSDDERVRMRDRHVPMAMTVWFGTVHIRMLVIMVGTVAVKVLVNQRVVRMFQLAGVIRGRPEHRGQHRKSDNSAGQQQRRRLDSDPGAELPRHRVENQPAQM